MDEHQFDRLRRRFVLGGLAAALGLGATPIPDGVTAKKRKKKRPNAFGCLNVGQACGGKNGRCCSGICQGKKPKKGKKDTSRCVAHHAGGCTVDRHLCTNPTVAACSAASTTASCFKTTGNAGFCAESEGSDLEVNCLPCRRDPDCEEMGFGTGSACVILRTEGVCVNSCEGINDSAGTACLPPAAP
jgi:hypothetical protein